MQCTSSNIRQYSILIFLVLLWLLYIQFNFSKNLGCSTATCVSNLTYTTFLAAFHKDRILLFIVLACAFKLIGLHSKIVVENTQNQQWRSHWIFQHKTLCCCPIHPHIIDCYCFSYLIQYCIDAPWTVDATRWWYVAFIPKCDKDLLGTADKRRAWGLPAGVLFMTNILNFSLRQTRSWKGIKRVKVNTYQTSPHTWVHRGKFCFISWGSESNLAFL